MLLSSLHGVLNLYNALLRLTVTKSTIFVIIWLHVGQKHTRHKHIHLINRQRRCTYEKYHIHNITCCATHLNMSCDVLHITAVFMIRVLSMWCVFWSLSIQGGTAQSQEHPVHTHTWRLPRTICWPLSSSTGAFLEFRASLEGTSGTTKCCSFTFSAQMYPGLYDHKPNSCNL